MIFECSAYPLPQANPVKAVAATTSGVDYTDGLVLVAGLQRVSADGAFDGGVRSRVRSCVKRRLVGEATQNCVCTFLK